MGLQTRDISIHAPHARSDEAFQWGRRHLKVFQSTLLMRGATSISKRLDEAVSISIHAPHARSDGIDKDAVNTIAISIHAPHARSDFYAAVEKLADELFQSTLLMRGATSSQIINTSYL